MFEVRKEMGFGPMTLDKQGHLHTPQAETGRVFYSLDNDQYGIDIEHLDWSLCANLCKERNGLVSGKIEYMQMQLNITDLPMDKVIDILNIIIKQYETKQTK